MLFKMAESNTKTEGWDDMGKFSGVLLASDFDNTMVYTEGALRAGKPTPPMSEKNRAALEYFMAEGGSFAIATGRALPSFIQYANQVPMNVPGIVCNGAALYDFEMGEYLETTMLDEHARQRGQAVMEQFPQVAVEAYHLSDVVYAVHPNEYTRQHLQLTKVGVEERPSLLDVPVPLGKLLFEADHATLQAVQSFLNEQSWIDEYEMIFSGQTLLELTAKHANKGRMVSRLAARLQIPMEHVYCAGDEANDISMLTIAATGFAPANCIPAVRDCGAVIVSHAEEDAMADVIAYLDRKY